MYQTFKITEQKVLPLYETWKCLHLLVCAHKDDKTEATFHTRLQAKNTFAERKRNHVLLEKWMKFCRWCWSLALSFTGRCISPSESRKLQRVV